MFQLWELFLSLCGALIFQDICADCGSADTSGWFLIWCLQKSPPFYDFKKNQTALMHFVASLKD